MVYSLISARKYLDDDDSKLRDIIYEPSILETLLKSDHDISVAVDVNWLSYWQIRFEDPLSDAETLN